MSQNLYLNSINKFWLTLFLFSIFALEFNFLMTGLNVGNLVLIGSSIMLVISTYVNGYLVKKPGFSAFTKELIPYILYLFVCLLSVMWSVSGIDTLIQSLFAFIMFGGCIAASRYDYRLILFIVFKLAFVISLLSIFSVLVSSEYAFQPFSSTGIPELRGLFKHQQRLGLNISAVLGVYIICLKNNFLEKVLDEAWYRRRYLILFIFLITVLAAQARLFGVFFVVAIAICLFYKEYKRVFNFLFVIFILYTIYNFESIVDFLQFYDNDELTLTGRTTIWTRTYLTGLDSPILGYGFATFDVLYFDHLWTEYRPPHAHNSFLQAFFDMGIIGFILLNLVIVGHLLIGIRYVKYLNLSSLSLFLVLLSIFSGLTGVVYFGKLSTIMTLTLLFLLVESRAISNAHRR